MSVSENARRQQRACRLVTFRLKDVGLSAAAVVADARVLVGGDVEVRLVVNVPAALLDELDN
jgi:hypothetical protein